MSIFGLLYRVELRRLKTPVNVALPFLLLALTGLIAFVMSRTGTSTSLPSYLMQAILSLILPITSAVVAGGMISFDVKEHWARTTLLRPVTREMFLVARILAVFTVYIICVLIAGIIPLPLASLAMGTSIDVSLGLSAGIIVLSSLQALLIVILLTVLSCWLPGITNIVILAVWAMFSPMIGNFISSRYWDSGVLTTLKDFVFPSGFLDAIEALRSGEAAWAGILWGCAALTGFSALTIWSFNRMNVESGSD